MGVISWGETPSAKYEDFGEKNLLDKRIIKVRRQPASEGEADSGEASGEGDAGTKGTVPRRRCAGNARPTAAEARGPRWGSAGRGDGGGFGTRHSGRGNSTLVLDTRESTRTQPHHHQFPPPPAAIIPPVGVNNPPGSSCPGVLPPADPIGPRAVPNELNSLLRQQHGPAAPTPPLPRRNPPHPPARPPPCLSFPPQRCPGGVQWGGRENERSHSIAPSLIS